MAAANGSCNRSRERTVTGIQQFCVDIQYQVQFADAPTGTGGEDGLFIQEVAAVEIFGKQPRC